MICIPAPQIHYISDKLRCHVGETCALTRVSGLFYPGVPAGFCGLLPSARYCSRDQSPWRANSKTANKGMYFA